MKTKKTKTRKKNAAAVALGKLSRAKRFATTTFAERSEQARRAVNNRKDRQPKPPVQSNPNPRFTWTDGDIEITPPKPPSGKGGSK